MRKLIGTAVAVGLLFALAPIQGASAKARHARRHHHPDYEYAYGYAHRPIVVERRSFLDPGTVVPVGTYTNYVHQRPYANIDPPGTYQSGTFMMDTLHPPFGANAETGGFGP